MQMQGRVYLHRLVATSPNQTKGTIPREHAQKWDIKSTTPATNASAPNPPPRKLYTRTETPTARLRNGPPRPQALQPSAIHLLREAELALRTQQRAGRPSPLHLGPARRQQARDLGLPAAVAERVRRRHVARGGPAPRYRRRRVHQRALPPPVRPQVRVAGGQHERRGWRCDGGRGRGAAAGLRGTDAAGFSGTDAAGLGGALGRGEGGAGVVGVEGGGDLGLGAGAADQRAQHVPLGLGVDAVEHGPGGGEARERFALGRRAARRGERRCEGRRADPRVHAPPQL